MVERQTTPAMPDWEPRVTRAMAVRSASWKTIRFFAVCLVGGAGALALGWYAVGSGYELVVITVSERGVETPVLRFRDEAACARAAAEVRRRLGEGAIVRDCRYYG